MAGSWAQIAMQQVMVIGGVITIAAAGIYILLGVAETGQEELGKGQELAYAEIKMQNRLSSGDLITLPKKWLDDSADYRTELNVTNPHAAESTDLVEIEGMQGNVVSVLGYENGEAKKYAFYQQGDSLYVHANLGPEEVRQLEIYSKDGGEPTEPLYPLQGGGGSHCVLSGEIRIRFLGNVSIKGDNGQATSGGESCKISAQGCSFSSKDLSSLTLVGEKMELETSSDAVILAQKSRFLKHPHTLHYYVPPCSETFTHSAEKYRQDPKEKNVHVFNHKVTLVDKIVLKTGTGETETKQSKTISPDPADLGKFWSVYLPANTSYGLENVPNYLSCSTGAYFVPETKGLCGMQIGAFTWEGKPESSPPKITNIQYAPRDPAGLKPNTNDEIQIQAVATDDQNLSNCELTIDDTTQTYPMGTMTPDGKQENTYDSKSEIIWANILTHTAGNRSITITCWDVYNNKGQAKLTVPVTKAPDHAGPRITNLKTTPTKPTEATPINVTAEVSDESKVHSCIITIDGSGSTPVTPTKGGFKKDEEIEVAATLRTLSSGSAGSKNYLVEIYCNDTAGNHALENTTITVVDGKPPQTTTTVTPPEALIDNLPVDTPIKIQTTATDQINIDSCQYYMDSDPKRGEGSYSSPIKSQCNQKDPKSLSCTDTLTWHLEGEYKIKVECLDKHKNKNTTEYTIHYEDTIVPTIDELRISPEYPKSSSDPTPSTIIFTAQVTDNVEPDQCRIKIGTQSSEMQLTETKGNADSINSVTKKYQHSTTLPTGSHTITILCNDTSSPENIGEETRVVKAYGPISFEQKPQISPAVLEHGKTSTARLSFSLDALDANCSLSLMQHGMLGSAEIAKTKASKDPSGQYVSTLDLLGLDPGTYTSQIHCFDPAGHTLDTGKDMTIQDTTPPTVGTITPTSTDEDNPTQYSSTVSDNHGIQECVLQTGISTLTMSMSQNLAQATETIDTPGTYTFTVSCTDLAGNNAQKTATIDVADKTPPTLGQFTPLSLDEDKPTTVSVEVSDNVQVASCVLEDKTEPSTKTLSITGGSAHVALSPSEPGEHVLEVSCSDAAGNTNSYTKTLTVLDKTPPTVGPVKPSMPQTVPPNQAVTLSVTFSDDSKVTNCALIIGSTTLSMTIGPGEATVQHSFSTAGVEHQTHATCTDEHGNTGNGFPAVVKVTDTEPPQVHSLSPLSLDEETPTIFNALVSDNVGVKACSIKIGTQPETSMNVVGTTAQTTAQSDEPGQIPVVITCKDNEQNTGFGTFTLSVNNVPPSKPVLSGPPNGAQTGPMPMFSWQIVNDASQYELVYATHTQSGPAVVQTASTALANGVYQWRVKAIDSHGFSGPWSDAWSFTVSQAMACDGVCDASEMGCKTPCNDCNEDCTPYGGGSAPQSGTQGSGACQDLLTSGDLKIRVYYKRIGGGYAHCVWADINNGHGGNPTVSPNAHYCAPDGNTPTSGSKDTDPVAGETSGGPGHCVSSTDWNCYRSGFNLAPGSCWNLASCKYDSSGNMIETAPGDGITQITPNEIGFFRHCSGGQPEKHFDVRLGPGNHHICVLVRSAGGENWQVRFQCLQGCP